MIDKKSVALHFSRAAATYDRAARVQTEMVGDLLEYCPPNNGVGSVLEIGAGTGLLSDRLLALYPEARFTLVDISPGMAAFCREKYDGNPRVTVVEADGEEYRPGDVPLDLIVSGAAFQWYEDPAAALNRYREMLSPGGSLVFSTFGPATFRELFDSFRAAYRELDIPYSRTQGQPLHPLDYWEKSLNGFRIEGAASRIYTLKYPDVSAFFRALRDTGATNAVSDRRRTPPRAVRAMMRLYREMYPGEIPVTYEGLFIAAVRGPASRN